MSDTDEDDHVSKPAESDDVCALEEGADDSEDDKTDANQDLPAVSMVENGEEAIREQHDGAAAGCRVEPSTSVRITPMPRTSQARHANMCPPFL
jgi:hypothetical protein